MCAQLDWSDGISKKGAAIRSTRRWESCGSDRVWGGALASSATEGVPKRELEGLLVRGGAEHGSEAEVQSIRGGGGRADSASEKEGEATADRGTDTASLPVWEAARGTSVMARREESEGWGLEFRSVCEVMTIAVLLAGWVASSSSGPEISCSDTRPNGSRTCRDTRGIKLQTRHSRHTHTHRNDYHPPGESSPHALRLEGKKNKVRWVKC